MSFEKKDRPNWGGNAFNKTGVGDLADMSKDEELSTRSKPKPDTSPDPEHSVGGPKVKRSIVSEPRSSVD